MKKKTIYLAEEDVDQLRELANRTGKAQSELIREGIRRILSEAPQRRFRSAGVGEHTGAPRHWTSDELYAKVFRERLVDERGADR